jgi:hypothetical protein
VGNLLSWISPCNCRIPFPATSLLPVEFVGLLQLIGLEGRVAFLLLLLEKFGFLKNKGENIERKENF